VTSIIGVMSRRRRVAALIIGGLAAVSALGRSSDSGPEPPAVDRLFARDVLAQLVELDRSEQS